MLIAVTPFRERIGYVVYALKAKGIFSVSAVDCRKLLYLLPYIILEKSIELFDFVLLFLRRSVKKKKRLQKHLAGKGGIDDRGCYVPINVCRIMLNLFSCNIRAL